MGKFGTVKVKVDELLKESGMRKYKVCYKAEVQKGQLNRFCKNEVTRLDADVLARFCYAFGCSIGDLLEYIPPEESEE